MTSMLLYPNIFVLFHIDCNLSRNIDVFHRKMANRPVPLMDSVPERILNIADLKKSASQRLAQSVTGMKSYS